MGAPVKAYVRFEDKKIELREPVIDPDVMIVQDVTLFNAIDVDSGLKPGGWVLINTHREPFNRATGSGLDGLPAGQVLIVPATDLALKHLKRPTPKTVLSGTKRIVVFELVQAIGRYAELDPIAALADIETERDQVQVDANVVTGAEGVFAGGDLIPYGGSATEAIGDGKRAARAIDAYVTGVTYRPSAKSEPAKIDYMETWYYRDAPRSHRPLLDQVRRTSEFAEVVGNLDAETAAYGAWRCMSCGNCFECDNS
jgi:Pyruvate/2-oxoacid:ferredoxin oxidoreductase gamma subunit